MLWPHGSREGWDKTGSPVAVHGARISEIGRTWTNGEGGIEVRTVATHPRMQRTTPGKGRGVSWVDMRPEVHIRTVSAHGPAWLREAVAPSLAKRGVHTFATLFSLRKATRRPIYGPKKCIYRVIIAIYGEGRVL